MSYSSCLNETRDDLVLDTSVIINLNGSGAFGQVLDALPNRVLVTSEAAAELLIDTKRGRDDHAIFQAQIDAGRIEIIDLGEAGRQRFEQLISDPVRGLGDGEAATIAAAEERGNIAVIDEKQARALADGIGMASSVDIFTHSAVRSSLGRSDQRDAIHNALKNSRMSVQEDQRDWIVSLLGPNRAAECNSLPRHKELLQELNERQAKQHQDQER